MATEMGVYHFLVPTGTLLCMEPSHTCKDGIKSDSPSWWVSDAQGIPLCRVCALCEDEKLSGYRPEILHGYGQLDVDEPIDEPIDVPRGFDQSDDVLVDLPRGYGQPDIDEPIDDE